MWVLGMAFRVYRGMCVRCLHIARVLLRLLWERHSAASLEVHDGSTCLQMAKHARRTCLEMAKHTSEHAERKGWMHIDRRCCDCKGGFWMGAGQRRHTQASASARSIICRHPL